jgi:hypothetical protein
MSSNRIFVLIPIFFCLIVSCAKEQKVDRFQLLAMAKKVDPTVEPILAKDLKSGVRCVGEAGEMFYGQGCLAAFKVQVGPIDMIALEFDSEESAKAEALRLDQWHYKNWVFDDVTNEPTLERFIQQAFGAIRPKKADTSISAGAATK